MDAEVKHDSHDKDVHRTDAVSPSTPITGDRSRHGSGSMAGGSVSSEQGSTTSRFSKSSKRSRSSLICQKPLVLDPLKFPPREFEYAIGLKIDCKDSYTDKWYVARIRDIDEEKGVLLVHYDYWNDRYDEWIDCVKEKHKMRACSIGFKKPKYDDVYHVDDYVFAKWGGQARPFPARITKIDDNAEYELLFYDGFLKKVKYKELRKMKESEIRALDLKNFGKLTLLPEKASLDEPLLTDADATVSTRRRSTKRVFTPSSSPVVSDEKPQWPTPQTAKPSPVSPVDLPGVCILKSKSDLPSLPNYKPEAPRGTLSVMGSGKKVKRGKALPSDQQSSSENETATNSGRLPGSALSRQTRQSSNAASSSGSAVDHPRRASASQPSKKATQHVFHTPQRHAVKKPLSRSHVLRSASSSTPRQQAAHKLLKGARQPATPHRLRGRPPTLAASERKAAVKTEPKSQPHPGRPQAQKQSPVRRSRHSDFPDHTNPMLRITKETKDARPSHPDIDAAIHSPASPFDAHHLLQEDYEICLEDYRRAKPIVSHKQQAPAGNEELQTQTDVISAITAELQTVLAGGIDMASKDDKSNTSANATPLSPVSDLSRPPPALSLCSPTRDRILGRNSCYVQLGPRLDPEVLLQTAERKEPHSIEQRTERKEPHSIEIRTERTYKCHDPTAAMGDNVGVFDESLLLSREDWLKFDVQKQVAWCEPCRQCFGRHCQKRHNLFVRGINMHYNSRILVHEDSEFHREGMAEWLKLKRRGSKKKVASVDGCRIDVEYTAMSNPNAPPAQSEVEQHISKMPPRKKIARVGRPKKAAKEKDGVPKVSKKAVTVAAEPHTATPKTKSSSVVKPVSANEISSSKGNALPAADKSTIQQDVDVIMSSIDGEEPNLAVPTAPVPTRRSARASRPGKRMSEALEGITKMVGTPPARLSKTEQPSPQALSKPADRTSSKQQPRHSTGDSGKVSEAATENQTPKWLLEFRDYQVGRESWLELVEPEPSTDKPYTMQCTMCHAAGLKNRFAQGVEELKSMRFSVSSHEVTPGHQKAQVAFFNATKDDPACIMPPPSVVGSQSPRHFLPERTFDCEHPNCSRSFRTLKQLTSHVKHFHKDGATDDDVSQPPDQPMPDQSITATSNDEAVSVPSHADLVETAQPKVAPVVAAVESDENVEEMGDIVVRCSCKIVTGPPIWRGKDWGQLLVKCGMCKTFQHAGCLGLRKNQKIPASYRCYVCKGKGVLQRRASVHADVLNDLPAVSTMTDKLTTITNNVLSDTASIERLLRNTREMVQSLQACLIEEGTTDGERLEKVDLLQSELEQRINVLATQLDSLEKAIAECSDGSIVVSQAADTLQLLTDLQILADRLAAGSSEAAGTLATSAVVRAMRSAI